MTTDPTPPPISVRVEADIDLAISDVWPDGDDHAAAFDRRRQSAPMRSVVDTEAL